MANLEYDPDLKQAVIDIKQILKKYDISGAIGLCSKTHAEFYMEFPEWSCVKLEESGKVAIDIKRENFESMDAAVKAVQNTTHVLLRNIDMSNYVIEAMEEILSHIEPKFDITHEIGKPHPHKLN